MLTKVNSQSFQTEVREHVNTPVVVLFTGSWCNPCKQFKENVIEDYIKKHSNDIKIVELDSEDSPELFNEFSVRSLPTSMIVMDGMVRDIHVGSMSKSDFRLWIQENV